MKKLLIFADIIANTRADINEFLKAARESRWKPHEEICVKLTTHWL
jgi:hypothetical protein